MSWVWALIQVCSSFAFWAPFPSMVPCVLVLFLSQILLYWIYVSLILLEIHHWALDSLCGPYTKQQHTLVLNKETRGVFFFFKYIYILVLPVYQCRWDAPHEVSHYITHAHTTYTCWSTQWFSNVDLFPSETLVCAWTHSQYWDNNLWLSRQKSQYSTPICNKVQLYPCNWVLSQ